MATTKSLSIFQIILKVLTKNFTGVGATTRWVDFLRAGTIASLNWTACGCVASFLLHGLFIFVVVLGTEQDQVTKDLYLWITSSSLEQITTKVRISYGLLIFKSIQIGLLIGFGSKIIKIIAPEIKSYRLLTAQR